MKKICFVIGVRNYGSEHLAELPGCDVDAKNLFETLTDPDFGEYDKENSYLLFSPTLHEILVTFDVILATLANSKEFDVFTFAFSGHGGVKTGNLYLCAQDTVIDRMSTTALPLSQVFTIIKEAVPSQTNIIIDVCEAGGVVVDLRHIITPELLGAKDTPGISILASAASDQSAGETEAGGVASSEIIKCLRGEHRVQNSRQYLNLIEVGNFVSNAVSIATDDQTPVVWGLNLFGDSFLSKNPHFEGELLPYSYSLANIPAGSPSGQIIQQESRPLWDIYQTLPSKLDARALVDVIVQPCEKLDKNNGLISSFIRGLSQSIPAQAKLQNDVFAEPQALACCIVGLLPFINVDEKAKETIVELSTRLSIILQEKLEKTYASMISDRYSIMSTHGGSNDLFILPLRISKILGWASAHAYISGVCGINEHESISVQQKISKLLVENYCSSIVAISDTQSPYLWSTLSQLNRNKCDDLAEQIFGATFCNFIENRGMIAKTDISPEKIPEFLIRRNIGNFDGEKSLYAHPDELLSVLMYFAGALNLQNLVDPFLERIDHHQFNVFLANDHTKFAGNLITNGTNVTFQIGYEKKLGVFQQSDFKQSWDEICEPIILRDPNRNSQAVKIAVLLSSLLFPNRVPWLLR